MINPFSKHWSKKIEEILSQLNFQKNPYNGIVISDIKDLINASDKDITSSL